MVHQARVSAISFALATLVAVGPPCSAHEAVRESPSVFSGVAIKQANITRAVASLDRLAISLRARTGVPGIAIAVVQGSKLLYARGFGVRTVGSSKRVDANTVFELASVSKPLASTIVAGAVGRGIVRWDDPVAKYLPGFTLSNSYVGSHVTIADMFAHRSGLYDHAGDLLEDLGYTRTEIIAKLALEPLDPFRVSYHYTNMGLTAAAQAVADAAGTSWHRLSQRILYGPLGMKSTSSRYSEYANRANKASLHVLKNGTWTASAYNADVQSPAGGASSSVHDLAKWMILELSEGRYGGKQIINKGDLAQTQQPLILTAPAPPPKRGSFYGLGMDVSYDATGRVRLSHSGAFAMGASTAFELLPSAHLGIVVLTNGVPLGIPEAIDKEFYDIVEFGHVQRDWFAAYNSIFVRMLAPRGELVGKATPWRPSPAQPVSAYLGTYVNPYYGPAHVVLVAGSLQLVLGKGFRSTLTHWDGNTFAFLPTGESATGVSAATFAPAASGKPATLTIEYLNREGLGTFTKL